MIDRIAGGKSSIDVNKIIDESIVDELEKEGFFKTFGK
jgi:hypothetical protein